MPSSGSLLWSYLNVLTKQRFDAIRDVYGTLEKAKEHLGEEMLRGLGCREETVRTTLLRLEEFDQRKYEASLRKRGIIFLDIEDASYPKSLREIGDPPPFLYARGDISILSQPCIAVVGTRDMTDYGKRVAEDFTAQFVRGGLVTVSGLAEGVDAVVARETLRLGGKTVAVLGHGLGMIFPTKHAKLANEIVESGGLLLSEFPLDISPGKYTFPARNRIIAGLSLGTVVIEAPEGSGAIITADLATEYGRDVFAVPGEIFDPSFAGCHALIAKGARIATCARDVLEELGIVAPEELTFRSFNPSSPDEAAVYSVLTTMPQDTDTIVKRAAISAARISATLTLLELQGVAKNVGGGAWVRT